MISTVTTITNASLIEQITTCSIIAVIALIMFLAIKEVLSTEARKNRRVKQFVKGSNTAIVPLLFVFLFLVVYKVLTII